MKNRRISRMLPQSPPYGGDSPLINAGAKAPAALIKGSDHILPSYKIAARQGRRLLQVDGDFYANGSLTIYKNTTIGPTGSCPFTDIGFLYTKGPRQKPGALRME